MGVIAMIRSRAANTTTGLFAYAPNSLENTLDHAGDPGLLGPDSVTWRVIAMLRRSWAESTPERGWVASGGLCCRR